MLCDVELHAAVPHGHGPPCTCSTNWHGHVAVLGAQRPHRLQSFLRLLLYDSYTSIQSVGPVHVQQACMVAWPSRLARMKTLSIPFVHTHCIGLGAPALSSGVCIITQAHIVPVIPTIHQMFAMVGLPYVQAILLVAGQGMHAWAAVQAACCCMPVTTTHSCKAKQGRTQ